MMGQNEVLLSKESCNGCGLCVTTCPQLVFEQGQKNNIPSVSHKERCYGCLACEEDCPKGAIIVHRMPREAPVFPLPEPGRDLKIDFLYDLLVIGAGPAGLGAAIRGRLLGLSVAVIERMPSPSISHHPDGGLFFASQDVYQVDYSKDSLHIKELDLEFPQSMVKERLQDFSFVGPKGQRTKRRSSKWCGFPIVNKDEFVAFLSQRAQELGATIAYNTRAKAISSADEEKNRTVTIDGDRKVKGKVLISAEGISGRLTAKTELPVNEKTIGWSVSPYASMAPITEPSLEASFLVGSQGDLPYLRYISSGPNGTHMAAGPIKTSKKRMIDECATDVLLKFINEGKEEQELLGRNVSADEITFDGCRALVREIPKRFVATSMLAVGDTITTCGMITNLLALKTGDIAAQVANGAIRKINRTDVFLSQYEKRVRKIDMFMGLEWMTNLLFKAPMKLREEKLNELFDTLSHLCLSRMQAGEMLPLLFFYLRISPTLFFDRELRRYLLPW